MEAFKFLSSPRTLSVMPTYTCTAACTDCGTLSSPKVKENISLKTILTAIEDAKKLNFSNVVFTGGEATLRMHDLLEAIKFAVSLEFPVRLVTNAHWAKHKKKANQVIEKLYSVGLREINFSTGDEHLKFIPLQSILNGTLAALNLNMPVCIMVELRSERRISKADVLNHPEFISLSNEKKKLMSVQESPWMPLNPFMAEGYPVDHVARTDNLAVFPGCPSVLQTYVIQADGNIGSCCGIGLRLIPELNVAKDTEENFLEKAINRSENDFLKIWLRYKGPTKILAWAAEKDPSIKWENVYAHKCQACIRLYHDPVVKAVIREHYQEMLAEVLTTAYMTDVFLNEKFRSSRIAAENKSNDHASKIDEPVAISV